MALGEVLTRTLILAVRGQRVQQAQRTRELVAA
jgi:hypothetical protein